MIAVDTLFLATISPPDVAMQNLGMIPWDSAPINPGGNFDTSLHAYVAPVDGYYQYISLMIEIIILLYGALGDKPVFP